MIPGCNNPDCPCDGAQAARESLAKRHFPALEDHIRNLNDYAAQCHEDNMKWWYPLSGCTNCTHTLEHLSNGIPVTCECGCPASEYKLQRNKGELLMLIVSEIAEAMEGVRKDSMDDKLPHRKMEEVELADALIRIFDYAGAHGLDIDGAYQEKRAYNKQRADHKPENRAKEGGKRF